MVAHCDCVTGRNIVCFSAEGIVHCDNLLCRSITYVAYACVDWFYIYIVRNTVAVDHWPFSDQISILTTKFQFVYSALVHIFDREMKAINLLKYFLTSILIPNFTLISGTTGWY